MLFEPARKWESTSTRVPLNVGRSLQKRLTVLRTCRSSSHLLLAIIIATAAAATVNRIRHATSGPTTDHGMCSVKKVHMEVQWMSFLWKRAMGNFTGDYQTDNVPGELSTQIITNEMGFILKLKPWDSIVWGTAEVCVWDGSVRILFFGLYGNSSRRQMWSIDFLGICRDVVVLGKVGKRLIHALL